MIAGTIVFAVSYGIAVGVALIDDFNDQTSWLTIPIAGPWLMMYNRAQPRCDTSQTSNICFEEDLETILRFYLAVDGVAPAAGATMLGFGIAGRKLLSCDDGYGRPSASCPPGSARRATARCWRTILKSLRHAGASFAAGHQS